MTAFSRALLCLFALELAGCQLTRLPGGTVTLGDPNARLANTGGVEFVRMRTPYPIIYNRAFTSEKEVRALAAVLTQAFDTGGGMAGVAADVSRCYAAADADNARNSSWPSEYRFCVLYDAVAYRLDNTRARDRGRPRTPFFETEVAARRWQSHIYAAGQDRLSQLDTFMMKGAAATGRFLPAYVLLDPR